MQSLRLFKGARDSSLDRVVGITRLRLVYLAALDEEARHVVVVLGIRLGELRLLVLVDGLDLDGCVRRLLSAQLFDGLCGLRTVRAALHLDHGDLLHRNLPFYLTSILN